MHDPEWRTTLNRFATLLEKGKEGSFTVAEFNEMAHLLNSPILGSHNSSADPFKSELSFRQSNILERLRAIDWFAHCGQPLSIALSMPFISVSSWREAMLHCMDDYWEGVTLEASNQLTQWLHHYDRENYQQWNLLVDGFKMTAIDPLASENWEPVRANEGLGIEFIHSVKWDVLGALMENAYLQSGHRCFFFLELLLVYEAGHFPCGWTGKWPKGKLVIY